MAFLNGVDVHKSNCLVVLVHFVAGDFTLDDFGEDTVLHALIIPRVVITLKRKYNKRMNFLKKVLYQLTGALFKLLLVLVPIIFAVSVVFGSPKHVETALKESRVYDQIVGVIIDNSKTETTDATTKDVLAQPEIQATAEKAFNPTVLQGASESFIQGIYGWLQGKTTEPQFTIDLTAPKATLIQGVTDYAKKRADSLPVCTLQQLRLLNPNMDLLSLPCRPPGTNTQQVADQFSKQFQDGADFLDNPVITNDTLTKNNNGESIGDKLSSLPKAYKATQTGKWVLFALTMFLGALLVFGRRNKQAGAKHVAWAMIGVATFLIISEILYWFMFDKANQTKPGDTATQTMIIDGSKVLIHDFNQVLLWFTAAYVVIGAGLLILLRTVFAPDHKATDPLLGEPELHKPTPEPEKKPETEVSDKKEL